MWKVNPSNGAYSVLNDDDWTGATSMVLLGDSLYIIQASYLHKLNVSTGTYTIFSSPGEFSGPALMSAYRFVVG